MPLSFTVVTTPADRVGAELLAVPVGKGGALGPGADAVDAALGGGLAAFLAEAGFEGKLGETLAVPTAGRLRRRPRSSWASATPTSSPSTASAAPRRRSPRRASKAASVATTLATAAPGVDVADAAQAVAEGIVLGSYQYLEYKGDASPTKLKKVTLIAEGGAAVRNAVNRRRDGR